MGDPQLAQLIGEVLVVALQIEAAARRRTIRRKRSVTITFDSGILSEPPSVGEG